MKINCVNNSSQALPQKYLRELIARLSRELLRRRVLSRRQAKLELTVVFLNPAPARKINQAFRRKDYATDVLSFPGEETFGSLGELILCPQVLKRQAKEHGLSFREELTYMLIHGVLHLLGFDHEQSEKEAQKMFRLQDQIFDKLC
jgi:probable rRNA maturation factor